MNDHSSSQQVATTKPSETSSPRLEPATKEQAGTQLLACLTLVAPSGMTARERSQWLKVAWHTVGHLPADILANGCKAARERCRFPSEIVPTILDSTRKAWGWRQESAREKGQALPAPQSVGEIIGGDDIRALINSLPDDEEEHERKAAGGAR